MKRRDLIKLLTGAAAAIGISVKARASKSTISAVGVSMNADNVSIHCKKDAEDVVIRFPKPQQSINIACMKAGETYTFEYDHKKGWVQTSVRRPYMGAIYNMPR